MQVKFLEIRDRGTHIDVIAFKAVSDVPIEQAHLTHNGYGQECPCVILTRLSDRKTAYNRFDWDTPGRTMQVAHGFIRNEFDNLETGDVVDVEFILGETEVKKISEYGK